MFPDNPMQPVARTRAGFTLVEVIVVLAVVLLLTGIAVPMISGYMEDGRRARAAAEVKVLASSIASFYKDVGTYPTRNSSGTAGGINLLVSGSSLPSSSPWIGNSAFATWATSSSTADVMDNQLLANTPGGQSSAAYPTTGSNRWRGPYLAGPSPLDPWGRPYIANVISSFSTNSTNYKRMYVLSAGPNGRFDTPASATATADIADDDIGVILHVRQ
ncbi:MAG: hypothetical protein Fur0037_14780 [Planctomycetota bacterium]